MPGHHVSSGGLACTSAASVRMARASSAPSPCVAACFRCYARSPGVATDVARRLSLDKSEIERTPNGMSRRFGDVRVLRRLLIGVTVLVVASLSSLAYASPPDPTWIPGFYDDADFDDVVGLVVMEKGLVESQDLTSLRYVAPPALVLLTSPDAAPASHSVPTLHARAPPSV